jgi:Coenzyme PQQ synthesis protein D (PqqD)
VGVVKNNPTVDALLDSKVRVPQGVVYRAFVKETVVLNLETGRYHGVNPTGGRMLDALSNAASVREAATKLAQAFDRPEAEIEADLSEFCEALLERGLIEVIES